MTTKRLSKTDLPERLADAIRQAWPDGVIDMPANMDEAPFCDVLPKLKSGLSRIPGTSVLQLQPGGTQGGEASDTEVDSPEWNHNLRSYRLFFVCPLDDRFRFECDTIEPDEDGIEQRFQGEGRVGCLVGVSLVAPFALVRLDEIEVFENGSRSDPDVEPHIFSLDGRKLDMEEHYREMFDDDGVEVLRKLRAEIVRILNDLEFSVIPEEDLEKAVPWLRVSNEVLVGHAGEPITVRRALFFHGL